MIGKPNHDQPSAMLIANSIKAKIQSLKDFTSSFESKLASFNIPSREISQEELTEAQDILEKYKDISFSSGSKNNLTAEDFAKKTPAVLKYFAEALMDRYNNPKE